MSYSTMNLFNVACLQVKPTITRENYSTTELIVVDKDDNEFAITLFHSKPLNLIVPPQKKEPMDTMEALNDLCTIR